MSAKQCIFTQPEKPFSIFQENRSNRHGNFKELLPVLSEVDILKKYADRFNALLLHTIFR